MPLPAAHRLAQINHLSRTLTFAFAFLLAAVVAEERGQSGWTHFFAFLSFLVYPQLAYLHARLAVDSKRAEFRNLMTDSLMVGAWISHAHFALMPTLLAIVAISLDNVVCGGLALFVRGLLFFAAGAAAWGAVVGFHLEPDTGPLVTAMSCVGILAYVTALGEVFYVQNKNLLHTRNALRESEAQFRFIAEHAGDLVAVVGADGFLRYASPSHEAQFGRGRCAPGQDWLGLVHPDDRPLAGRFLQFLGASMTPDRAEMRMVAADGASHLLECQGNPVAERGGKLRMIVLVCRDLSARPRRGPAAPAA
jgi:PAS domain S-box-containing protein